MGWGIVNNCIGGRHWEYYISKQSNQAKHAYMNMSLLNHARSDVPTKSGCENVFKLALHH